MSVLPVGFGSAVAGGYQIERSLRFNSADSAYLNRTPASASNRKTWTWSCWYKRSNLSTSQMLFSARSGNTQSLLWVQSGDTLRFYSENSGGTGIGNATTSAVFRDVGSWYHIMFVLDASNATAANRIKIYVNGVEQAITISTTISDADHAINSTIEHTIGREATQSAYLNGYLTEINFIDGQALTPSDFGETDSATGVWKPKAYTGTYGTNGFELLFADNSGTTSTTLGKDSSGNGNNWTPNLFSVTAGVNNDSLVDSPTSYGTDTGVGGEVRGNYATLNPLKRFTANATLSNGNLTASDGSTTTTSAIATMNLPASGKWYWEVTVSASVANGIFIGACPEANAYGTAVVQTNGSYRNNGTIYNTASVTQTSGATYTTNDVIGVAVDVDNGTVQFYKNGTAQGATPSFSFTALTVLVPFIATDNAVGTKTVNCNFGQRPFEKWNGSAYVANTAPSGFKALCTQNLPTPTIGATSTTQANDYFNVVLYTGTGSSLGVTGVNFQPDFVWIKGRSGATDHGLYDAVRGVQKQLESNTNTTETTETTGLTAFGTDGFTVGALAQLNTNTATYVAWNWKANGAGSTNTAGSITSTVSANTTSGFSIVTASASGTSPVTVGHGCLVNGVATAPRLIIGKVRDVASTNWYVYSSTIPASDYLVLNSTAANATSSNIWDIAPTSTVFTVGNPQNGWAGGNSGTKTYVFYCFAAVAGYSAFGSYTGNGSADGPFVYTNFRPAYVLVKRTNTTGNWQLFDSARDTYNVVDLRLEPNLSNAEASGTTAALLFADFLSNGFKIRGTDTDWNASGSTYIYAAFAESPFKYALAR